VARGRLDLPIVTKFDKTGLQQAKDAFGGFGKSLAGIGAAVAAAFSIRAIGNFAREAVLAAEGIQQANARIGQIAKSTALFGAETEAVTKRMIDFADANELRLGVEAEVIKGVQAQLLSFKALGATADETGGVFDRTTEAAFNMAAAGFGSAEGNAVALGKALEDPVRGLTALRRSGTTFTEEQQGLIAALVETGDLAGAQELILGELESQYGGVAEATALASTKMGLAFDQIQDAAGEALLPIFAQLTEDLIPVFGEISEAMGDTFTELGPVLSEIAGMIPGLVRSFMPLIPILGELAAVFLEIVAQVLPFFVELFDALLPTIQELAPLIAEVFLVAMEALLPIFLQLVELLVPIIEALLPVFLSIFEALAPVILSIVEAFMPLIEATLPLLVGFIELITPMLVWLAELLGTILVYAIEKFAEFVGWLADKIYTFALEFAKNWYQASVAITDNINTMITGFESLVNFFVRMINRMIEGVNVLRREMGQAPLRMIAEVEFGRVAAPELPQILQDFYSGASRVDTSSLEGVMAASGRVFQSGQSGPATNTSTLDGILASSGLPRLAEGGIVNRKTLALIGEAGPEAVVPLDRNARMGGDFYVTVNAGLGTNGADVGREIVAAIRRYERTSGRVFASA
jgi:phage-related protein